MTQIMAKRRFGQETMERVVLNLGNSTLFVVAAVLVDQDGKIMIAKRANGSLAGLWEFPGGKLEEGENPRAALCRELREELAIDVRPDSVEPFTFVDFDYPNFSLFMPVYFVRNWAGEPQARVHSDIKWVDSGNLSKFDMPPADDPVVELLSRYQLN